MTRSFLRSICRALVGVVLLAQLAVSAYACPLLPLVVMNVSAIAASSSMEEMASGQDAATPAGEQGIACADMAGPMDSAFANLCAEHCHHGQQSDQAATLTVPAALLTALYITASPPEPVAAQRPAAAAPSALAAASAPLAILHCCFRI